MIYLMLFFLTVVAFNCQMGRGRTTAGQIMAVLVSGILACPAEYSSYSESITPTEESSIAQTSSAVLGSSPEDSRQRTRSNGSNGWDGEREDLYLSGMSF